MQSFVCQVEGYRNILTQCCRPFAFPHIKQFSKIKRGLELASFPHFLHNFWIKIFLLLCSVNWPSLIVWLPLLPEILSNICCPILGICLLNRLWRHEFWSWSYLSNQAFFPTWQKSHDKNLNILRTKRAF